MFSRTSVAGKSGSCPDRKVFREQNRGCTLPDGGKNRFREQNGGLVLPQGLEEELPGTKRGRNVPGRDGGPA